MIQSTRSGFTLIETLIVVALLGIIAAVALGAIRKVDEPSPTDPSTIVAAMRRRAIHERQTQTSAMVVGGRSFFVTALADGTVLADTALHFDRLTGRALPADTANANP